MIGTQMKYLTIPLLMTLTMCTAPVTHPTQASEWEKQQPYPGMLPDNSQVINSWIQDMRNWKSEQNRTPLDEMLNNSLLEYEEMDHGCDGTTEQEELLQLPSNED